MPLIYLWFTVPNIPPNNSNSYNKCFIFGHIHKWHRGKIPYFWPPTPLPAISYTYDIACPVLHDHPPIPLPLDVVYGRPLLPNSPNYIIRRVNTVIFHHTFTTKRKLYSKFNYCSRVLNTSINICRCHIPFSSYIIWSNLEVSYAFVYIHTQNNIKVILILWIEWMKIVIDFYSDDAGKRIQRMLQEMNIIDRYELRKR